MVCAWAALPLSGSHPFPQTHSAPCKAPPGLQIAIHGNYFTLVPLCYPTLQNVTKNHEVSTPVAQPHALPRTFSLCGREKACNNDHLSMVSMEKISTRYHSRFTHKAHAETSQPVYKTEMHFQTSNYKWGDLDKLPLFFHKRETPDRLIIQHRRVM